VGFEPTVHLHAHWFSRPAQSATLSPLRRACSSGESYSATSVVSRQLRGFCSLASSSASARSVFATECIKMHGFASDFDSPIGKTVRATGRRYPVMAWIDIDDHEAGFVPGRNGDIGVRIALPPGLDLQRSVVADYAVEIVGRRLSQSLASFSGGICRHFHRTRQRSGSSAKLQATNHSKTSPRREHGPVRGGELFVVRQKRSHDIHKRQCRAPGAARSSAGIRPSLHGCAPGGSWRAAAFDEPSQPRGSCPGAGPVGTRPRDGLPQSDGTE
jgi:hypothetical protein